MKDNGLLTGVIGAIAVNAITVEKWVGIICSAAGDVLSVSYSISVE